MAATTVIAIVFVLAVLIALLLFNLRERIVFADGDGHEIPVTGFPHDAFEALLTRYVSTDGYVDYAGWRADAYSHRELNAYLAAVAELSPVNAPERFPTERDTLAYWMYAYNAYVVWSVLDKWPLKSVTDVKAPLEIVRGLGFFYRRRFPFGGEYLSLYHVENEIIRKQYRDPRIHFVLNCGSESCPTLRPELPTGEDLQRFLDRSTADFLSDPKHVEFDHDARRLRLSAIFRMYKSDFVDDLRAQGLPSDRGPIGWVEANAPEKVRDEFVRARDYSVDYKDFDWAINGQ
ncbi:MAG: DUF547 domain-containing protein [Woeseiaceae bacterium]|nr:DUF547 domain-containing protein [Woeseiaceae bacterium]